MKKKLSTISTLIPFTLAPSAYAASSGTVSIPKPPQFKIEDLGLFVSRAINIALMVAAILVFVYLVWGGIQWIMSGGDKAKTEEARSRITAAIVGLAVVAAAWAVMLLVQYFFGLDIFGGATSLPPAYE